ncbi:hypothetical protein [Thermosediminibacter litoriperuensis]|uniref:Uncharacterized protein n=1 Tax=Thermosediminibacter litoriperuensis TaxID=291989 RepID=A0A5S5AUY7_9FIRM|nr:hypothetical protein [Thermosediminibacter litoriperuensis]TYP56694.1 hypothetical protein LZ11_00973 [Thermosediminibacter litoriperuensis]
MNIRPAEFNSLVVVGSPVSHKGFTFIPVIDVTIGGFTVKNSLIFLGNIVPQAVIIMDKEDVVGIYALKENFRAEDALKN